MNNSGNDVQIEVSFLLDGESEKQVDAAIKNFGAKWNAGIKQFTGPGGNVLGKDIIDGLNDVNKQFDALAIKAQAVAPKKWVEGADAAFASFRRLTEQTLASSASAAEYRDSLGGVQQMLNEVDQEINNISKSQTGGTKGMQGWMASFILAMTGMQMSKWGSGILSPISTYVKASGQVGAASSQWLATQTKIEQSVSRMGGAMAESVLPAFEKVADVISDIADLFDKYPALATGAVVTGVGLSAAGKAASTVASLLVLKQLFAGGALAGGAAAGTGAGAAIAGGAAVAAPFLFAGSGAVMGSNISKGLGNMGLDEFLGKGSTVGAYYLGKLFGGPEKAAQWGMSVGKLTKQIENLDSAATKTASDLQPSAAAVDAFISYRQQEREAEQTYSQERLQIVKNYTQQMAEAEETYQSQRADLVRDFAQSLADSQEQLRHQQAIAARDFARYEAQSEDDYYRQRTKASREYSVEIQRMEADHQRKMLQAQAEHLGRVDELTDKRDALGLWRENQNYERQRSADEAEYNVEAGRRSQDFAVRLAEMENEFSIQRERRQQAFQQQIADQNAEAAYQAQREKIQFEAKLKKMDAEHKAEMAKLEAQKNDKLRELDSNYRQERAKRLAAFNDQLRDIDATLMGERSLRQAYYNAMSQDLQTWLISMRGQFRSNLPGYYVGSRASGGYVNSGLWQMHNGEFVMNAATTSLAERLAGQRLNQNTIMAMLTGGRGPVSVTWNDQRRFDGKITAEERRMIQQDNLKMLETAYGL